MAHISEAGVKKINEICDRYANEKTPLMMILSDIQNEYGYIPLEVQQIVSKRTGISVAEIYGVVIFNYSLTIDGSIKETLKAVAETKTQTQYQYATSIAKRVKNTEIIVDKQGQSIDQLVTDMYEEDGIINENFTKVHQNINNIINSVQNSGGSNLIKNSVMFAYDNSGIPMDWETAGDGTLEISTSAEALANGSLSGHIFTLNNKKVIQRITVKTDDEDIPADQKTYYTFSTKIKKGAVGSCYVKMYNSNEEYIIELKEGETAFYKDFEIKGVLPKIYESRIFYERQQKDYCAFICLFFFVRFEKKQNSFR